VTACNVLQEMAEKNRKLNIKENKIHFLEWKIGRSYQDIKQLEAILREKRSEQELQKKKYLKS
jgi:hypothetical protein